MGEEKPGRSLAERLKAGIEQAVEDESQAALARQRRETSARQRRIALMGDLEAFGRAVGHIKITHRWGTLTFRFQGCSLRFKADGGAIVITGEDLAGSHRCLFEETLGKWALHSTDAFGVTDRILMFDAGLARLMARGLHLK